MEFDAFTAGIELGGLRSTNDIKLLICYMLSSVQQPLSKEDVLFVLQENGLANYFEINSAFADLVNNKNISLDNTDSSKYIITDAGKMIATQLNTALPLSVREKAVTAALSLLAKVKREQENTVSITKCPNGYSVNCVISGGQDMELLSLNIVVPDSMQAELVKQNFQNEPNLIYSCMLALLTKNNDLVKSAIENLQ